jgi:hypothetical protein
VRPDPARGAGRVGLALAGALMAGGCAAAPPPIASHDLERPTDISLVCMGLFDQLDATGQVTGQQVSGRPMSECHPSLQFDPPTDLQHRTFAFVTNTARGELAVIDMDATAPASQVVDLDPAQPENNPVPLGVLPEQMAASDDGCRLVTANRGSCDLSMVDPGAVLTPKLDADARAANVVPPSGGPADPAAGQKTETVVVHGASGTALHAAPQEVRFLPQNTAGLTGNANLCPLGFDSASPTTWRALVTFPSCDLVALVDLPSGRIVDSMFVSPSAGDPSLAPTLTPGGTDPTCPAVDFCGLDGSVGDGSDAGAVPDGGVAAPAAAPGARPGALALLPDGSRVYVGLGSLPFVMAIDVTPDKLSPPAFDGDGDIALHDNALGSNPQSALGSTRLRLSVDPYQKTGVPGAFGRFVGEGVDRTRQYLYVFALDGTVRVIDVSLAKNHLPETECDANVDPSSANAQSTCPPIDPSQRRPEATGPGLHLPSVPVDAAFADVTLGDPREQVLDGSFGFILTTSGSVYIVNIAPTLRTQTLINNVLTTAQPPEVAPPVNSLRDQDQISFLTTLDPSQGPPRVDVAPVPPLLGPQLEGIPVSLAFDPNDPANLAVNATITSATPIPVATYVFFPQRTDVTAQVWTLTWEGDLFGPSFSGQMTPAPNPGDVAQLTDQGIDFCQQGALAHDIVTLFGCTIDQQCGPGRVCRTSDTVPLMALSLPVNGICVDTDATLLANELLECADLQNTVKRYEIVKATPSALTLRPKIDEIPSTLLATSTVTGGCVTDDDCHPPIDPSRDPFVCRLSDHRCVQPCTKAAACQSVDGGAQAGTDAGCPTIQPCRLGRVCVDFGPGDPLDEAHNLGQSFCADAPNLTPTLVKNCLSQLSPSQPDQLGLAAYKLEVGNGFVVQGSGPAPIIPRGVDPTNNTCVADFGSNPLLVNRIPLTLQTLSACSNQPDIAGAPDASVANTRPVPNPCRFMGGSTATDPLGSPPTEHMRVLFQNAEVRFILTNVDQYAPDITPIQFVVHGGFLPQTVVIPLDVDVDEAARIVPSPIDSQAQLLDMSMTHEIPYLFVVDQRRIGRASAGVGATRGQVLRIHPRLPNSDASNLIPTYEDPSTSANLWPVQ